MLYMNKTLNTSRNVNGGSQNKPYDLNHRKEANLARILYDLQCLSEIYLLKMLFNCFLMEYRI